MLPCHPTRHVIATDPRQRMKPAGYPMQIPPESLCTEHDKTHTKFC